MGASILDCHAVQGNFSTAFWESLSPEQSGKGVRVYLEWVCFSILVTQVGAGRQQPAEACPRCRCYDGVVPPPGSPWAQQSNLSCHSQAPSPSRGERTTRHLRSESRAERPSLESRKQQKLKPASRGHLGQPLDRCSGSVNLKARSGWSWGQEEGYVPGLQHFVSTQEFSSMCNKNTINASAPKFFPEIHVQSPPSPK